MSENEADNDIAFLRSQVQLLRHFLNQLGNLGFYERNAGTGEVTPNHFWTSCGYRPEDLMGERWLDLVHPDDVDRVREILAPKAVVNAASDGVGPGETWETGDGFEIEYRVRTAWGQWRWVLNRGVILSRDQSGNPIQYLGIDIDITDRKLVEDELRLQREAAEQRALEAETLRLVSAVVASALDPNEAVKRILDQASNVVPYEHAVVYKLNGDMLEPVGWSGGKAESAWAQTNFPNEAKSGVGGVKAMGTDSASPHAQVLKEGHPLIFNRVHELFPRRIVNGRMIRSWMGVPLVVRGASIGMLSFESTMQGFFSDSHSRMASAFADHVAIALENTRLYEELKLLAITDELTGLYTRRWMQEYAVRQLDRCLRNNTDMTVLMIDVDYFKRVNDDFGHIRGDAVLKRIAEVCSGLLRSGDVICRYGGEEFMALLPDTDVESALGVAERLRQGVESTSFVGIGRAMTASIGISSLRQRKTINVSEIIHESDTALYQAKNMGRNRTETFKPSEQNT